MNVLGHDLHDTVDTVRYDNSMKKFKSCCAFVFCLVSIGIGSGQEARSQLDWQFFETDSDASLRGLCVYDQQNVWASGTGGTVLRTTDGGESWQNISVPGAEELDFRDVQVLDAQTAIVMNAGMFSFSVPKP